jgi:hypothetical protein
MKRDISMVERLAHIYEKYSAGISFRLATSEVLSTVLLKSEVFWAIKPRRLLATDDSGTVRSF